jgi:hypothetical protein
MVLARQEAFKKLWHASPIHIREAEGRFITILCHFLTIEQSFFVAKKRIWVQAAIVRIL